MNRFIKRLFKIVFSRATVLGLSVFLQFVVLMAMFNWLANYTIYMYMGIVGISFLTIIVIINSDSDALVKIGWIAPIATIPIFGILFYLFMQYQPMPAIYRHRYKKVGEYISTSTSCDQSLIKKLKITNPELYNLAHYSYKYGSYPIYDNSYVKYFSSGEPAFHRMLEELNKAEKFIFLESFIIEEGYMWEMILDILEAKANKGVDVRVIYDGTCSVLHLPFRYLNNFADSKIQFKIFNPIRPLLTSIQNNRDHRKILIVDGNTAFTGGINISDEYINQKKLFGHWKDTAVMIKGDAVCSFSAMFLQNWNFGKTEIDDIRNFLCTKQYNARGFVIPYGDNPYTGEHLGLNFYLDIINKAKSYVHIYTPYLIPNDNMLNALEYAAKRGVDVKIILPGIQDKNYCRAIAYRFYPQLVRSGVKLYHYTPGFVHAKSIVSDDKAAIVGTQNFDFRSLFFHFECGAFFCQTATVGDVEDDFNETLKRCEEITEDYIKRINIPTRIQGTLLKLIAPLL